MISSIPEHKISQDLSCVHETVRGTLEDFGEDEITLFV